MVNESFHAQRHHGVALSGTVIGLTDEPSVDVRNLDPVAEVLKGSPPLKELLPVSVRALSPTECNGLLTYDREINKVIPQCAAAAGAQRSFTDLPTPRR